MSRKKKEAQDESAGSNKKVVVEHHKYELKNVESGTQTLQFIEKVAGEDGKLVTVTDGTTNEAVIEVLIHRITALNDILPSSFNSLAISKLQRALVALNDRTRDRQDRSVEGTGEASK